MAKYDIKKELKRCYAPSNREWAEIEVSALRYLMVDGHGDPNTAQSYADAVEALFSVSYKVKFLSKSGGKDYVVGPLEGLWWAEDPEVFVSRDKSEWDWTMMIAQPEWIGADLVDEAIGAVAAKKEPPALHKLRFAELTEGRCAQVLHIGSYDDEAPLLHELHHEWMPRHGLDFAGKHHEIYLSDPRRVEAAKLRTILRQPVRPSG